MKSKNDFKIQLSSLENEFCNLKKKLQKAEAIKSKEISVLRNKLMVLKNK